MQYIPYYDVDAISNIDERFRLWGQLADWSDRTEDGTPAVNVYEWVKSDVPPSEWDALAEVEEGNTSIPEASRKAGRARQVLFEDVSGEWVPLKHKWEEFDVVIEGVDQTGGTYRFSVTEFISGDELNVYINGRISEENVTVPPALEIDVDDLVETDRVRFVKLVPTDEDFIEAEIEAGNLLRDYEYTQIDVYNDIGVAVTDYYFWVDNKGTRSDKQLMSPSDAAQGLVEIPTPYVFFQKPLSSEVVEVNGTQVVLPVRFVQSIIRGLRGLIDDDFRYVIRFTRDFTLRDSLEHGKTEMELKNLHDEWELFREQQPYHIKRSLWDKITESMVGYTLANSTVRVPSYERELYDQQWETDTQYGLRTDQTFVSSDLATSSILADLKNPDNDFYPVDINVFFENHNFDTDENTIDAMTTIYETFAFEHVNRMFFSVLHDAFSLKSKYPDIFKTSMIALHGIRPFQVGGLFDD